LLLYVVHEVDIIEPLARFTTVLHGKPGVREIFNVGLQDWQPAEGVQYDLVWTQWCLGHLTDEQLIGYLGRCRDVLNPDGGVLVAKENLSTSGFDFIDDADKSVTRWVTAQDRPLTR
jgi:protein N-terminal methyltransferase